MKDILFLTDFDGTVTYQDFYKQLMLRYEHDKTFKRYPKFLKRKISCLDFLSEVFKEVDISEEEFYKEIESIPLDPYFIQTAKILKENEIDIKIVSAGCKYYIERALQNRVDDVDIIALDGVYKLNGLEIIRDKNNQFYCNETGIDKKSVVEYFKHDYKKIIYAGDSAPDYKAALKADVRFAKGKLSNMLKQGKIEHLTFENYKDIKEEIVKILNKRRRDDV